MTCYFYWSGPDFDFGNYLAVASAAVMSPGVEVVMLIDEPPPPGNVHFRRLSGLPRVRVEALHLPDLMSPAHARLYRSMRFTAHRADLVRFCVLHRYGGVYLDTDTLCRRSVGLFPPAVLFDDGKIVHIGVMALPAADPLLAAVLDDLLTMPEADLDVYQSIVYRWTALVRASGRTGIFGDLAGVFPVHWKEWESIFLPGATDVRPDGIHVLHHYGYFSRRYTAIMDESWIAGNDCLFSTLARDAIAALPGV